MWGSRLSQRVPAGLTLCLVLLAIPLGALYFKVNASQAAHPNSIHYASVYPRYRYAEQSSNKQFKCHADTAPIHCYAPQQIYKAYSIQAALTAGITGKGSSIVILDAYQAPNISNDLRRFDAAFGLPDPVLNVIAPDGLTPFDPTSAAQVGWSGEISLDVQWAHAVAPSATIDLVLAKSSQDADLIS